MKLLHLGDLFYDYDEINEDIEAIGEHIRSNHYLTILNLEAPLKSQTPLKKWTNLFHSENVTEVLKKLNVVAVNLANNHIMDWNKDGLVKIIDRLDKSGVIHFGAGFDLNAALEPKVLEVGSRKIALIGFGWKEEMCVYAKNNEPGVAPLEYSYIMNAVENVKRKVDYIIVHLHWGYEYELYPLPVHRNLARQIIDRGVDLIIGHHPHVIQSKEVYKGKHIYYSLGNFYFGSLREKFNNKRNKIAREKSRYGLGVLHDAQLEKFELLHFESSDNKTFMTEPFEIHDISAIDMSQYNNFFKINRTSTRKPGLFISKYDYLVNPVKLKLNSFKEFCMGFMKRVLKFFGLFELAKSFMK